MDGNPSFKFAVGDAVEIVGVVQAANRSWVGRRTVVVSYYHHPSTRRVLYCVADQPPFPSPGGFRAEHLRKIDPPDWEAPRVRGKELQT